jgi:hypothetical protein
VIVVGAEHKRRLRALWEEYLLNDNLEPNHQAGLRRVMVYATALAFGGLGAFLFSLRDMRNDPALEFSGRTVIAFVVGATLGYLFWRVIDHLEEKDRSR